MGSVSLGAIPENKSFVFNDESIEKMKDMLKRTNETGYEYGATVCRRGITLSLIGEQRGMDKIRDGPTECPEGTEMFGSFHTHPKDDKAELSYNDIIYGLATGSEVMCVGYGDEITCFEETLEDIGNAYDYLKDNY